MFAGCSNADAIGCGDFVGERSGLISKTGSTSGVSGDEWCAEGMERVGSKASSGFGSRGR